MLFTLVQNTNRAETGACASIARRVRTAKRVRAKKGSVPRKTSTYRKKTGTYCKKRVRTLENEYPYCKITGERMQIRTRFPKILFGIPSIRFR